MIDQIALSASRATGIVALVLVGAALIWGFAFSAGETGRRLRPAWWLDLHNWLGGAALVFTAVHILTAVLVSTGPTILDAVVPSAGAGAALGLGVLATYLLAAAVLSTWPRRLRARPVWRLIHLGSVLGAGFALVHGLQLGVDASSLAFRAAVVVGTAPILYVLTVRVAGVVTSHRSRRLDVTDR